MSIQIFGATQSDADAAQCRSMGPTSSPQHWLPVPKIAKHHSAQFDARAGALASVVRAMAQPCESRSRQNRAGWNEDDITRPGCPDGETPAARRRGPLPNRGDRIAAIRLALIARVAEGVRIPVFGSGDALSEPDLHDSRSRASAACWSAVFARPHPWIFARHPILDRSAPRRFRSLLAAFLVATSNPARRASQRGRRFRHSAPATRNRPAGPPEGVTLGHQQVASAGVLVHKGTSRWLRTARGINSS